MTKAQHLETKIRPSILPEPFLDLNPFCLAQNPFDRVTHYNLRIVPAGTRLRTTDDGLSWPPRSTSWVFSCKSGRMVDSDDFFSHEGRPTFEAGYMPHLVLVMALLGKSENSKPRAVNLYTTPYGAVYLACISWVRSIPFPERLVALEDAPLAAYLDLLPETNLSELEQETLGDRLKMFYRGRSA